VQWSIPAPPPLPYLLPLSPAPPLTFFICFNSQQIEPLSIKPKLITAESPPAPPRRRSRKQSAPPVKLPSTSRPDASHPVLAVSQGSPEPRRSSIPVRRPRRRRSIVNPRWALPLSDLTCPSDFDLTHQINPLNRRGTSPSGTSRSH
jgi:hypothetical protein